MNIKEHPYLTMIGVRLWPETRDALHRLVTSEQTTVSAYVRKLIEQEAKRDLPGKAQDDRE